MGSKFQVYHDAWIVERFSGGLGGVLGESGGSWGGLGGVLGGLEKKHYRSSPEKGKFARVQLLQRWTHPLYPTLPYPTLASC